MLHLNQYKTRFTLWLIITTIIIIYFIKLILSGFPLNTNVLDLLPKSDQNPIITQAVEQFSTKMGNQLIFLIGNQSQKKAQKSAQIFYQSLYSNDKKSLFSKIKFQINNEEQQAWGSFYFPYRLSLLTAQQHEQLKTHQINKIKQNAILHLYSPMAISNSDLLKKDPYFLFQNYITAIPKPASNIQLINNLMMIHHQKTWYVMITAQLKNNSFSLSTQNKVVQVLQQAKQNIKSQFPHTILLDTGMLFYAKAGADSAQKDISTIGIGSIIGIILLILITFRSLTPLFLILFSSIIGFITAFVVTYLMFGSVYLFTLVFGASLIGISVDYAFFYYSEHLLSKQQWQPLQGLKNIFPGITLGLINIIIAYIIIAFTPFPGLQQLAIFASIGLAMAYLTVVCFFPMVIKAKPYRFKPILLNLTNWFLSQWKRLSPRKVVYLYTVLLILIIIGLLQVKANDNIQVLQSVPQSLKQNEKDIKNIIGSNISTNFIVIQGKTPEDVLQNEDKLTKIIHQKFPEINEAYLAINPYVPTISYQKQNYHLIQQNLIQKNLTAYLKKIGVPNKKAKIIKSKLENTPFKPLTIQAWLNSPVSASLKFLWLGKIQNQYVTILLPSNKISPEKLHYLTQSLKNVTYINKAKDISNIFKSYRIKLTLLLICAYFALFALLCFRYNFKKACFYILPPIFASLLSLAILGWLQIPLTLFNVLALILVLGIAVDYILFFSESKSTYQSTMLATSLSALTTILSFGLLALSSTPAIAYFGLTVLVGIICAFLLSPFIVRFQSKQHRSINHAKKY